MDDITCPGCHIGCSLLEPNCGRGMHFAQMLEAGEEIPKRRGPHGPGFESPDTHRQFRGPGGFGRANFGGPIGPAVIDTADGSVDVSASDISVSSDPAQPARADVQSVNMRDQHLFMLLCHVLPRALQSAEGFSQDDADTLLNWVKRQNGMLSRDIMSERTKMSERSIDRALDYLLDQNALEFIWINGREYFRITEYGEQWACDTDAARCELISQALRPLTDQDRETLIDLLHKLLDGISLGGDA